MRLARSYTFFGIGSLFISLALITSSGCSSSSTGGAGGTGGGGGTGGTGGGGTGGGGTGGAGGASVDAAPAFRAIAPCNTEAAYTTGVKVTFGPDIVYVPKCLKVKAGATVEFAGDFTIHPLIASKNRGDLTGNPFPAEMFNTGMSKTITFAKAGYFAYYCNYHGVGDNGSGMEGVVWVTP
jgi:plastocyanin